MKYKKIAILVTFFSLWLSVYFTNPSQEIIALVFIFSFGILHGSNDLLLIRKVNPTRKPVEIFRFFASYIGTVIIGTLLFYFVPVFALAAFIIFSAFHFGEQHWLDTLTTSIRFNRILFLSYGLTILFLLFALNSAATIEVIGSLTSVTVDKNWFHWLLLASGSLWLAQVFVMVWKKRLTWDQLVFELFMLLVFAVVFKTATLIWAFAIYFIFWHSIPSIFEQQQFLYGELSIRTFIKYVKSSFFIWLLSISVMALLFLFIDDQKIVIPLLFAFLGAITFAHSFTISKMFEAKK